MTGIEDKISIQLEENILRVIFLTNYVIRLDRLSKFVYSLYIVLHILRFASSFRRYLIS